MSEYDKQQIRKLKRKAVAASERVIEGEKRKIDLNTLARRVTLREGLKRQINIGQVKEVMKILFEELAKYNDASIIYNIRRKK